MKASLVVLPLLLAGCPDDSAAPPSWDGRSELGAPDLLRPDGAVTVDMPAGGDGPQADAPATDLPHFPDVSTTPLFSDVPATHPDFAAIQWVGHQGYLAGCGGSPPKFCPGDATTRAELAVAVVTMKLGTSFSYTQTPHFSDVAATHPAFKFIQKLYDIGATQGCDVDKFCPDDDASRAQGATVIVKAKFGSSFAYTTMPHFVDVPATHLAFKYIQKLFDEGIALGCAAGTFCPDDALLRQQLARMLFNAQTL